MARKWADVYDEIYADKDYAGEVATIWPLLGIKAGSILDMGCGTGEHARHLCARGLHVVGIDMDEDALAIARQKEISPAIFLNKLEPHKWINVCVGAVSLFNVVNYIQTIVDLDAFFSAIAGALVPGAPFIFDCWNGVAALAAPPRIVYRDLPNGRLSMVPTLDRAARVVTMRVAYHSGTDHIEHEYKSRLWTIEELQDALQHAGFRSVRVSPWMKPESLAAATDWKIMFVCRKA